LIYLDTTNNNTRILLPNNPDASYIPNEISPNDKFVLITKLNYQNNQKDIIVKSITDNSQIDLTNTSSDETIPKFSKSSDYVTYISRRDGKNDIYKIGLDGSNEVKLTKNGKVSDYHIEGDVLFFISEQNLFVSSLYNPEKAIKISDSVLNFQFGNPYYYYGGD